MSRRPRPLTPRMHEALQALSRFPKHSWIPRAQFTNSGSDGSTLRALEGRGLAQTEVRIPPHDPSAPEHFPSPVQYIGITREGMGVLIAIALDAAGTREGLTARVLDHATPGREPQGGGTA